MDAERYNEWDGPYLKGPDYHEGASTSSALQHLSEAKPAEVSNSHLISNSMMIANKVNHKKFLGNLEALAKDSMVTTKFVNKEHGGDDSPNIPRVEHNANLVSSIADSTASSSSSPLSAASARTIKIKSAAQRREAVYAWNWEEDLKRYPQLGYSAQRIPGYLYNSPRTLYGFVMRDFMNRICPPRRNNSSSSSSSINISATVPGDGGSSNNVLVVSKDAPEVMKLLQKEKQQVLVSSEEELRRKVHFSVAGSALIHAYKRQVRYTGLYDGHDQNKKLENIAQWWMGQQQQQSAQTRPPSEFQLLLVDSLRSDDIIKHSEKFLQEASVKYIVVSLGSDKGWKPYGMAAIRVLLEQNYKCQLLSISHATDNPYNHKSKIYRPNAEITAQNFRAFERDIQWYANRKNQPVRGYVFATHSLDQAIPLSSDYVEEVTINKISYEKCHQTYANIKFVNQSAVEIQCHNSTVEELLPKVQTDDWKVARFEDDVLWHSSARIAESEAVCVRLKSCKLPPNTKLTAKRHEFVPLKVLAAGLSCTTRILPPKQEKKGSKLQQQNTADAGAMPRNLLLLSIQKISRARFERSLPKTHRLLQLLDFTYFSNYTASYLRQSQTNKSTANQRLWDDLWDDLHSINYATLAAQDSCVTENLKSIDHGWQFNQMMCFNSQRCLGGKQVASHLLEYGGKFTQAYEKMNKPWAALLEFVDANEDSQTLGGSLDELLWNFIYNFRKFQTYNNTIIALLSDTGMDRGAYFQTQKGQLERNQPVFAIHLPGQRDPALAANANNQFVTAFDVQETLRDLLLSGRLSADKQQLKGVGSSLLKPLQRNKCASAPGVMRQVCDLFQENASNDRNTLMSVPPSALSFYADIPHGNKFALEPVPTMQNSTMGLFLPGQECVCSTSRGAMWHNCAKRPWDYDKTSQNLSLTEIEYFQIVDCGDDKRDYEIQVKRNPFIVERARAKKLEMAKQSPSIQSPPSILFIEVDSVSQAYADRHLPRTRELLNSLRLRPNASDPSGFSCNSNESHCAAEFETFSVVGPNSIPNQVAAFGGCIVTVGLDSCFQLLENSNRPICTNASNPDCRNQTRSRIKNSVCADPNHPCYGLERVRRHRNTDVWCRKTTRKGQSPWIFDIAKKSGYVTMFVEEFCYDGSPFVPQDVLFPLDVDYLPHRFFCNVAARQISRSGSDIRGPLWRHEAATDPNIVHVDGNGSPPRVDVSLHHIETFFEAYSDLPKFSYLNALSAHVYAKYPTMTIAAESYDNTLVAFLQRLLNRARDTIFVIRSDHGHQGGPNQIDFSQQIESFRPWTEMILPKNLAKSLPGVSLEKLFRNQRRLTTGADLYRVLTNLITSTSGIAESVLPAHSPWTIDFLNEEIPMGRNCADAGVASAYCIFESQRQLTAPNLGVCNLAEKESYFLCAAHAEEFKQHLAADVDATHNVEAIEIAACGSGLSPRFQRRWNEINKQAAKYPNAEASGDVDLCPRQTALLASLVQLLSDAMDRRLKICQTGFDRGHAASMFLSASLPVELHIFDKFDQPNELLNSLRQEHPDQNITFYPGDPRESVPKFLFPVTRPQSTAVNDVHCDVLYGSTDNIRLVERSPCGVLLATKAVQNLTNSKLYFGSDGQWRSLWDRGCIRDISCYGFQHENSFCIAITTGKCQRIHKQVGLQDQACERGMANFTNSFIHLSKICVKNQVPIPRQ